MTARGIVIVLAKIAERGQYGLSRVDLSVFGDGSGHLKLDDKRIDGTDFNNADDLCNLLEEMDKKRPAN